MATLTIPYNQRLKQLQSVIALLVLCLILSLLTDKFFTAANGLNVLKQVAVNICIATGMTLIVLTGGIDLSVGSVLALCGAITAGLLQNGIAIHSADLFIGFTILGAILVAVIAGGLLGLFNGFMITAFKVQPFVATLAMLTIARGLTMLYTGGHPISNLGADFAYIGTGNLIGIPVPVWIAAVVVLFAVFITQKNKTGKVYLCYRGQ